MRCPVMFITAICLLFLIKLKWPKNKSVYDLERLVATNPRFYISSPCLQIQSSPLLSTPVHILQYALGDTKFLFSCKKYFTRSLRSLVKYFSTLQEQCRIPTISVRPCSILYLSYLTRDTFCASIVFEAHCALHKKGNQWPYWPYIFWKTNNSYVQNINKKGKQNKLPRN